MQEFPPALLRLSPRATLSGAPGASLGALNTRILADGCVCWVEAAQRDFQLNKASSLTPNGVSVIAAAQGPGNWLKLPSLLDVTEDWKDSVAAVATSLPAYTRVGNTITANAVGALPAQDGVTLVAQQRVLVAIGTSADNGIYDVVSPGGADAFVLTRSSDAAVSADVTSAMRVPVATGGTLYGGRVFRLATADPIVLNTTALTFVEEQGLQPGTVDEQVLTWNAATATWNAELGSTVIAYPLGTGADDWTNLVPVLDTYAYQREVFMSATTRAGVATSWYCLSKQVWPSGDILKVPGGVTVRYDCRPVGLGSEDATPIYQNTVIAPTTTVAVLGVVGARTLTVADASALAVGDRVRVRDAAIAVRGYQIEGIAGAVLTLDASLSYPFPIGSFVTKIPLASQCRDIEIDGGGMQFEPNVLGVPVADKIIELYSSWDCSISNVRIDASGAALMGCSYDMGGVRNTWARIVENGGGNAQNGIALEGNRDSKITQCSTRENTVCGYDLGACTNCTIEDSDSDHDSIGVFFNAAAGDVTGCTYCTVRGGSIRNATAGGIAFGYGSHYNRVEGVTTEDCAVGISCGAFTGAASYQNTVSRATVRGGNNGLATADGSHDNLLESCLLIGQTGAGANLSSGPTTFRSTRIESSGQTYLQVSAGVTAYCYDLDLIHHGEALTNGGCYMVGAGSTLRGRGLRFVSDVNAGGAIEVFNMAGGGSVVDVADIEITFFDNAATTYAALIFGTSSFRCLNYKQTNGKNGFYLDGAASKVQIDGVLNINNIGATGLVFLGGGATQAQCNVGQLTADGINPTVVAIPQVAAQSVVRIWAPGGVLKEAAYTTTPGVGITITTILAAGTYFWQLVT